MNKEEGETEEVVEIKEKTEEEVLVSEEAEEEEGVVK